MAQCSIEAGGLGSHGLTDHQPRASHLRDKFVNANEGSNGEEDKEAEKNMMMNGNKNKRGREWMNEWTNERKNGRMNE